MTATKTIWVCKDGSRVPVRKMTDGHLCNTVRFLRRRCEGYRLREIASIDHYLRGDPPDGAFDAAMGAAADLADMSDDEFLAATIPTYEAMLAEVERRGLVVK